MYAENIVDIQKKIGIVRGIEKKCIQKELQ